MRASASLVYLFSFFFSFLLRLMRFQFLSINSSRSAPSANSACDTAAAQADQRQLAWQKERQFEK